MPKRKAVVLKEDSGDSSLSSPPSDVLVEEPASKEPRSRGKRIKVEVKARVDARSPNGTKSSAKKAYKGKVRAEQAKAIETETEAKGTAKRKKQVKEEDLREEHADESKPVAETKVKRKRKTKEEKEAEQMPLAARTVGHKLFIGAHVSSAGGVHNSVVNSVHIGANAFALFLKSQRKWANPPLADDVARSFTSNCKQHEYDQTSHVVPHGSYLVNLAHTDPDRTAQAYDGFLDDLKRCERLGIKLYNFHPGNNQCNDRQSAIKHLAKNINRAHKETSTVVTLLENMAAGGNVLGSTFEDLRDIISHVDNKSRIGVCIDTCHAFAAGYDLRSPTAFEATMSSFDEVVGMQYLRALHINDSKAPFASHRDLHANIGTGYLGLRAFHNVVNEPRLHGLPLILETPIDVTDAEGVPVKDEKGKEKEDKAIWAREIKLLESLVGMDVASVEFLKLEKELARKGEPERKRLGDQQDRKKAKEAKKNTPKKKRKAKDSMDEVETASSGADD